MGALVWSHMARHLQTEPFWEPSEESLSVAGKGPSSFDRNPEYVHNQCSWDAPPRPPPDPTFAWGWLHPAHSPGFSIGSLLNGRLIGRPEADLKCWGRQEPPHVNGGVSGVAGAPPPERWLCRYSGFLFGDDWRARHRKTIIK